MIRPMKLQKLNTTTKVWETLNTVHANINKASTGSSYMSSGSEQSQSSKTFSFRYQEMFSDIQFHKQSYRIVLNGVIYSIEDYDDYLEKHISIKLLGVSRGVRE